MAKANPFRFSTKYQDDETDLLYYGYRFYNGSTGRWLSRDPLTARGEQNLYACCKNSLLSNVDFLGQITLSGSYSPLDCGGFTALWLIGLSAAAPSAGYIVQHINLTYDARTCSGRLLHDAVDYWEAIPIAAGATGPAGGLDRWHYPESPGTVGELSMSAEIRFFPSSVTGDLGSVGSSSPSPIYPPWTVGGAYGGVGAVNGPPYPLDSGTFPSTGQLPDFWNIPPIEAYTGMHVVGRSWACCCPLAPRNDGYALP